MVELAQLLLQKEDTLQHAVRSLMTWTSHEGNLKSMRCTSKRQRDRTAAREKVNPSIHAGIYFREALSQLTAALLQIPAAEALVPPAVQQRLQEVQASKRKTRSLVSRLDIQQPDRRYGCPSPAYAPRDAIPLYTPRSVVQLYTPRDSVARVDRGVPLHKLLQTLRKESLEMLRAQRSLEAAQHGNVEPVLTAARSLATVMAARGLPLEIGEASTEWACQLLARRAAQRVQRFPAQLLSPGSPGTREV